MSWLTEYVRPKIRTLLGRRDVPENLWIQCPSCEQMLFTADLEKTLKVCTHCGHHLRATAQERLAWTFDDGQFTRIELPKVPLDPLRFRDSQRYTDRLRGGSEKTQLDDALLVAHGTIGGHKAVVAAMAFEFMGGSMGAAVGEGIVAAARLAVLQEAPLIIFTASGGARMHEGPVSLMQMPRTVIATRMVKEAGLPFIIVLTDPTTGGVTASFTMLGDIQIAEPGALIGFAGARVIEQTVREKLPEGFQRAEYLLEHGILDMVVKRPEMAATLARLIGIAPRPRAGSSGRGVSEDARNAGRIDAIIARLHTLYPRLIDLSLGRLERLLADLGHPERSLPPVMHVAGTNGKGSTCAFARAIGEAAGMRVHVTTSPHLVPSTNASALPESWSATRNLSKRSRTSSV